MHRLVLPRLPRLARLGLPAVAVLVLALGGCGEPVSPTPSATPPPPSPTFAPTGAAAGSDGLTIRYLGDDGHVKTVRVEDFPR